MNRFRSELLGIYKHAIDAVKPEKLIENAIKISDNSLLVRNISGKEERIDLNDTNIHVIGGGKSVLGMALGLSRLARESNISKKFASGVLSLPIDLSAKDKSTQTNLELLNAINVICFYGSKNNLPDASSVSASRAILGSVDTFCEYDRKEGRKSLFIVLLSGGGSACLTYPRFITLDQKLELMKKLVQKGANIVELNKVRRCFSHIKAGGLARRIFRRDSLAKVVTLVISDVIGDPIEYIASGPTYIDGPENIGRLKQQMIDVLEKYKIRVPELVNSVPNKGPGNSYLEDDDEEDDERYEAELYDDLYDSRRIFNCIIGNNKIAVDAAIQRAVQFDYRVVNLGSDLQGSTEHVVQTIVERGDLERNYDFDGKLLIVGGGESTVKLQQYQRWGRGGRAQEMALDYMLKRNKGFKSLEPNDKDLFLAAGTDGQDGPTEVAGCLASWAERCDLEEEDPELDMFVDPAEIAKDEHDSHDFWLENQPDWLIKTGLTGTNVMDLYMYAIIEIV